MLIQTRRKCNLLLIILSGHKQLVKQECHWSSRPIRGICSLRLNTTEADARERVTVRHRGRQLIRDLRHSNVSAARRVRRLHGDRSTLNQLFSRGGVLPPARVSCSSSELYKL